MIAAGGDNGSDLAAGTVISRYSVVRKLGAGQMGEVYEAQRTADGGRVAVKIVRIGGDGREPLRRFHREATLCASLRHPNIVPVIDYGVWEGRAFLVMPVLHGTDLDRLLERVGAIAPDVAVAIAVGCGRGLQVAHDASFVHRDFKPANVFLHEDEDATVTPIVCDFGVAKAVDTTTVGSRPPAR
jgi:eukaryotic-like serine/threonine-protein kinase